MKDESVVAALGKRIVLGTTGFTEEQDRRLREIVKGKVPAVFSPNFSVGINILFNLARSLKAFPQEYTFSVSEIHHTGKKDKTCKTRQDTNSDKAPLHHSLLWVDSLRLWSRVWFPHQFPLEKINNR